ncbi:MAG: DUF2333 family protein [Desulfobacterales bacterium]
MDVQTEPEEGAKKTKGFSWYAFVRILAAIVITVAVLWLISYAIGFFHSGDTPRFVHTPPTGEKTLLHGETGSGETEAGSGAGIFQEETAAPSHEGESVPAQTETGTEADHDVPSPQVDKPPAADSMVVNSRSTTAARESTGDAAHGEAEVHGAAGEEASQISGVAFMTAFIEQINYEVNERFWGWRPNDIIEFTDNVNNFQLGVLETIRRTSEVLHEHISRTGSTQAHNRHLERVRSNFMINADKYWLPSAENSYQEAIEQAQLYKKQLEEGTAAFYSRTANLLPLLRAYEYLLGSCDDNLVKTHEENGDPVSFFRADDYFYNAKGVASAMLPILEAVAVDFAMTIEPRRGIEVLHHAIEALEHANHVSPIIILNSGSSSLLANHRLNLAGPISHARFYVGLLIEALSI